MPLEYGGDKNKNYICFPEIFADIKFKLDIHRFYK